MLQQVGGDRSAFLRSDAPSSRPSDAPSGPPRDIRDTRPEQRGHEQQPVFSRQFQSNLPPRFQKQQAERTERHQFVRPATGGSQPASSGSTPTAAQAFDPRWAGPAGGPGHFQGSQAGEFTWLMRSIKHIFLELKFFNNSMVVSN